MARETHNVSVIVQHASPYTRYMQLLAAVKSIAIITQVEEHLPRDHFIVADRTIKISGFWPALEYVLDKYPGDNIQAGWSLEHRAVQRSLTHDLLSSEQISGIFETTLQRWYSKGGKGFLLEASTPSLVDLAYLAIGDSNNPAIKALRAALNDYVSELRAAYAA